MKDNGPSMHNKSVIISSFWCIQLFFLFILCSSTACADTEPIYMGVLLPLSGPEGQPLYDAITLARDQINAGGGIGGRPLELILRDTRLGDIMTYADYFVRDPRIRVVIGPYTSDEVFQVSEIFIKNHRVLISPTASSDEMYRAYAGTGGVWRTITNDGETTAVMMQHIKAHDGKYVSILTINSSYGETFYDWIPYWAIEQGIAVTGAETYNTTEEIPDAVGRLLTDNPDFLIFIHSGEGSEIREVISSLKNVPSPPKLYLVYPDIDSDSRVWERADSETLQALLDSGLWKIDMVSTVSTKVPDDTLILMQKPWDLQFSEEYQAIAHGDTSGYVPEAYDAVLAGAQVMARFMAFPDISPKTAAMTVLTKGTGDSIPRTVQGIQAALDEILAGDIPILTGATGPLTFREEGTDRLIPWYETYQIQEGMVREDPIAYTRTTKSDVGLLLGLNESPDPAPDPTPHPSGEFWAVIGSLSHNWENYRHQADALTMYQYIRDQGVPDDHIILLVYDDIPTDTRNKKPGEVYHTPSVEEVRKDAIPDLTGELVNKGMFLDILTGKGSQAGDPLLKSDENSTVLIYLSSHGQPGGDIVVGDGSKYISPKELADALTEMKESGRFGQLLLVLESCFSGVIASEITTPGVVIITAAAPDETSKAATYDSELSNWLSDEFTSRLITILRDPEFDGSIRHLYQNVYYNVRSSHPTISRGCESIDLPLTLFFGGTYDASE